MPWPPSIQTPKNAISQYGTTLPVPMNDYKLGWSFVTSAFWGDSRSPWFGVSTLLRYRINWKTRPIYSNLVSEFGLRRPCGEEKASSIDRSRILNDWRVYWKSTSWSSESFKPCERLRILYSNNYGIFPPFLLIVYVSNWSYVLAPLSKTPGDNNEISVPTSEERSGWNSTGFTITWGLW